MNRDAEALAERVAHLERVALANQARQLVRWGHQASAEEKVIELTPLVTVFDNRKVVGPHSHTGGVVVVISGSRRTDVDALMSKLGSIPEIHHPVLLVVGDRRDATYYRSLDPSGKDLTVIGTVLEYVTVQAGIQATLDSPPQSIKREFARVIKGAQLLEEGVPAKRANSSFARIRAKFRSRRHQTSGR
jgi:hypothetical protein